MDQSIAAPQTHRQVVSYIDKSREYYAAQGYEKPYRWASYARVPFEPWRERVLSTATIGVVTTSYPLDRGFPKSAYAAASSPIPAAMFTEDLSWDKAATHTDDVASFLPLAALEALVAEGKVGRVSPRFYGVPTEYSQRSTHADAEQIVAWAVEDDVDAIVLVPL